MKRKLLLSIFSFILFTNAFDSKAQLFEWVKGVAHKPNGSGFTNDYCRDMVKASNGDTYFTGTFSGTVEIGDTSITSQGGVSVFAARFDANGNLLWFTQGGQSGSSVFGRNVSIDGTGNVYLSGYFTGTFKFTGSALALTSNGSEDAFIAKLDPWGNLLWANKSGGTDIDRGYGLSVDTQGNAYLTGRFESYTMQVGSFNLINTGGIDAFITRYRPDGTVAWAMKAGGYSDDGGSYTEVDNNGNCYAIGNFTGTATFGTGTPAQTLSGSGDTDVYIASIDSSGTINWLSKIGGMGSDISNDMTFDGNDNIYITGEFGGTATFGTGTGSATLTTTAGFNGSQVYIAKFSTSGQLVWAQVASAPNSSQGFSNAVWGGVASDGLGNCYLTGNFSGLATFGTGQSQQSLQSQQSAIYVAKYNAGGNLDWAIKTTSTSAQYSYDIEAQSNGDCYIVGQTNGATQFGSQTLLGSGGFIAKVKGESNRITGKLYLDANSNGVWDAGEMPYLANIVLELHGADTTYITGNQGLFTAFTDSGSWSLSLPNIPLYHNLTQPSGGSYNSTFTGINQSDSLYSFGISPIPGIQDLRINLISTASPRPGFNHTYYIDYKNAGTSTPSGSVTFVKNQLLSLITSMPSPSTSNGDTLTWNYQNIASGAQQHIQLNFRLDSTAVLGDSLLAIATINPIAGDTLFADNSDVLNELIIGSFDPNDKSVNTTELTQGQVASGKWLNYTIRFQNTGTASAFNVRVVDSLSANLNIGTFEILASSHPMTWVMRGQGVTEFKFQNIMLPDSNANEPASHGFIKYRVRPLKNLVIGSKINNTAHIYFDYNAPVVTNTTTTEVIQLLSRGTTLMSEGMKVWPNPSSDLVHIRLEEKDLKSKNVRVTIYDLLGKEVMNYTPKSVDSTIDMRDFSSGIYILNLQAGTYSKSEKIVLVR